MQEFIKKSLKLNILLALAAALIFALMRRYTFGAGLLTGAIWSSVNFYLTLNLLEIASLNKPKKKLLLLLLLKFPVLYLLGFLILMLKFFPISSLLIGISSILLVLGVSSLWPKPVTSSKNCRI